MCSHVARVFSLTVRRLCRASAQDKALLVTALHCAAIGGWVPSADEKSGLESVKRTLTYLAELC